jgi:formylglycine-generating enzyme required for sulfatase activity
MNCMKPTLVHGTAHPSLLNRLSSLGSLALGSGALTAALFIAQQGLAADETASKFDNYVEKIPGGTLSFEMVAVPGGEITVGSPADEPGRDKNDLPQKKVTVKPFWMGKYEVQWELFLPFVFSEKAEVDTDKAQGITHPTKPYGSVYRDRGEKGYPAMGMSQLNADNFAKWISRKTGKKYRLPTEEEWEYACRAGATTAYFWGADPAQADKYGWYTNNSSATTQPIGKKQPNKFGLYDIVGNVSEWCAKASAEAPGITRGGAWSEPVTKLRCASRMVDCPEWNELDPQSPPSIWWLSAADFVGIRLVRSMDGDEAAAPAAGAQAAAAASSGGGDVLATYKKLCAGCHGPDGKGQTALGKRYKARDYTDPQVKASLKDDQMIKVIKEGLTVDGKHTMTAYADKLSETEMKALADYMKTFK